MVYRKKKKSTRPRTYRRKRKNNPRRALAFADQPKSKIVKLKYVEEITLDAATGFIAYGDYCANGLYDPRLAIGGHQPYGFDQVMVNYDHYQVIGAKITAAYQGISASNLIPGYLTVGLFDKTGVPASYSSVEHMLESNRIRGPVTTTFSTGQGYSGTAKVARRAFSSKKFFRQPFGENELQGSVAANPVERAVFCVMHSSVGGNNPTAANILITIEYIAVLTEPKLIDQS